MHWIYLKNISFSLFGALVAAFLFLSIASPSLNIGWLYFIEAIWGVYGASKMICEFEQHINNKKK